MYKPSIILIDVHLLDNTNSFDGQITYLNGIENPFVKCYFVLKRHDSIVTYLYNRSDVTVSVLKPPKDFNDIDVLFSPLTKYDTEASFSRHNSDETEFKYPTFYRPNRKVGLLYRKKIADNIRLALKKFGTDYGLNVKQTYERVGEVLELSPSAVKYMVQLNKQKGYEPQYRSVSGEEILIFEKELGIDRDDILGRRNSPYPRRSLLRELDTIMKEDGDVEDEVSRMLNHIKKALEKASKKGKMDICKLIHGTLNQYEEKETGQ